MKNFDITKENNFYPDLSLGFDGIVSVTPNPIGRNIPLPSINKTVLPTVKPTTLSVQDASRPNVTLNQITPKVNPTTSVKDIISGAVATHEMFCKSDVKLCPDGKTQVKRDPKNKCQFTPCPEMTEQESANYAFHELFGYYPSAYELNRFIELWYKLEHQPSAQEYKDYLASLQETATTSEGGAFGGGGGGAASEEKAPDEGVFAAPKKEKKWLLYGGIAAALIGIFGYIKK